MRIFGFITGFFILLVVSGVMVPRVFAQGSTTTMQNNACDPITDPDAKSKCEACMGGETNTGTFTALGCISTHPGDLLGKIIGLAIGMAGGIAFLLILFGGFQIMTSAGNPEQLNAGRELVSSAITGLLLIIFSIFILQFIGVNLIGIPGFGGTPGASGGR